MTNGDAIIAGDGPYTLLANAPEMYLQYRGDGTVWCRWPDGVLVEVVRKMDVPAETPRHPGELMLSELGELIQRLFDQREQCRRECARLRAELEARQA